MKSEGTFRANLLRSVGGVQAVASWMADNGFDVLIPPTRLRPSANSRRQFADRGDLIVRMRVEVKRRKIAFTCAEDYPYESVFVDECYKVGPQTLAYAIVNDEMTHVCFVPCRDKSLWQRVTRWDEQQKRECEFYAVELGLCTFAPLSGGV